MTFSYYLSFLIFSPLIGIVALSFVPSTDEKLLKRVGFFATWPPLILALIAFFNYRTSADLAGLTEKATWIQFFWMKQLDEHFWAIAYELGVDGFSLIMIVLTTVIVTCAALAVFHIKKEVKGFLILFLLLEVGMLGLFAAQNLLFFFLFFEVTLVAMFFLVGKWGYFEKEKAAFQFLIYNGIGSAILLLVIMVLFAKVGTTNVELLHAVINSSAGPLTEGMKLTLLCGLLLAFGIKLPIIPLHRWMLLVHVEAPPAIVMIHSGILLKIGAYGLIRFGLGIFPEQFASLALLIGLLGAFNLLYGAFLAFVQTDLKMVFAYSSISHMGIVLLGLSALNLAGIQGAMFQIVSHGLISALLFFLVGVFYERTGTTEIAKLGGLAKGMPLAAGFLLAGGLASLGLPGMSGFISEFTVFLGLFAAMPALAWWSVLGIILTAAYLLRAILAVTFGKAQRDFYGVTDMRSHELTGALSLLACIILIGVYPDVLSQPLQAILETIILRMGG